jgi:hypothetical protein
VTPSLAKTVLVEESSSQLGKTVLVEGTPSSSTQSCRQQQECCPCGPCSGVRWVTTTHGTPGPGDSLAGYRRAAPATDGTGAADSDYSLLGLTSDSDSAPESEAVARLWPKGDFKLDRRRCGWESLWKRLLPKTVLVEEASL